MTKKFLFTGIVIFLLLSMCIHGFAESVSQPAVEINGNGIGAVAHIDGKDVYLPLRAICEALGYEVQWYGEHYTVSVSGPGKNILIDLINNKITANGHTYYMLMDGYKNIENKIYMKTVFFSDNLGLKMQEGAQNSVIKLQSIEENAISIKPVTEILNTDTIDITLYYPRIRGLTDKTVQDKINSIFKNTAIEAKNEGLKNTDEIEMMIEEGYTGRTLKCETYFDYRLKYNQNGLLSIVFMNYQYAGGAHGSTVQSSYTLNIETGEEYELKDLMKSDFDYVSFMSGIVKDEINERVKEEILPEYSISPFEAIKEDQDFYLSADAVMVYFQQYEYFPYAAGIQEFPVQYSILKDKFKPDFSFLQQ